MTIEENLIEGRCSRWGKYVMFPMKNIFCTDYVGEYDNQILFLDGVYLICISPILAILGLLLCLGFGITLVIVALASAGLMIFSPVLLLVLLIDYPDTFKDWVKLNCCRRFYNRLDQEEEVEMI